MSKGTAWRIGVVILLVGLLASLPAWGSPYLVLVGLLFSLYLALAQMWNLLAGYSGLISLGQQCFVGLGGYTLAVLTQYYNLPIWLAVPAGGLVSVLFALVMAVPVFRMRGVHFAIGTWIVAESLMIWFGNWGYTKKGMGLFIKAAYSLTVNQIYYAALAMGLGATALVCLLLRSRLGLGLMALRDDEEAAAGAGVDCFRCKLLCFLIAAFVTGTTSGVLYLNQVFIQPNQAFGIEWTVRLCFIVIIGGIGTVEGPIIGALVFVLLQQLFAEYTGVSLILLGGFSVAAMLVMPRGLMGLVRKKPGFELLSPRRR